MKYTVTNIGEFEAALSASRGLPSGAEKCIVLAAGEYLLTRPILLDERDSGLTIRGEEGTALTGGCRLTGWQRDGNFIYAGVPDGAEPRMLVVNGEFRDRARYPEMGRLQNTNVPQNLKWMNSTNGGWNRPLTHEELTHMTVNAGDIPPTMVWENAEITQYYVWDESALRVESFDRASGVVRFRSEAGHPAGAFGRMDYVIWNTREGMTRPGQWYFDRAGGRVVYWPLPGEDPASMTAWVPVADCLILIKGGSGITLSGLQLSLCNTPAVAAGLRAINDRGTVEAVGAENFSMDHVMIRCVAGNGIKLMGCKNLTVDHCRVEQAGAGGIFTHECEDENITYNTIRSVGRISPSAIGIHCGGKSMLVYVQDGYPEEKGSVYLAHNTIDDAPYCGITCNGGPHRIEYNRLSRCMTVLNDGAAIYCSRGDHTVVRGNYVFDIDCELGYAYYFDEGSRNCTLADNLSVGVPIPVLNHMSEDVLVQNNVFVTMGDCTIRMARSRHFTWKNNIVDSGGNIRFGYKLSPDYQKTAMTKKTMMEIIRFEDTYLFSRTGQIQINDEDFPHIFGVRLINPGITVTKEGRIIVESDSPALNLSLPDGRLAGAGDDALGGDT